MEFFVFFNIGILLCVLSFCPLLLKAQSFTRRWKDAEKDDQKADANMGRNLESQKDLYSGVILCG